MRKLTGDELDAITAAYTGILYLKGDVELVGDPREGLLVLPRV
jgi:predicted nuclease with RNAse H fold